MAKYLTARILSINGGVNVSWKTDELDENQENIWTPSQNITPGLFKQHIVTEQDLIDNPDWVVRGYLAGQTIELTNDVLSSLPKITAWLKTYMDDYNKNQDSIVANASIPNDIQAVLNQPLNLE